MQKQSIEIDFLGQKITVKTEADPELVHEVVDLVTMKLADAKKRTPGSVPHYVAILALLDLAEEYIKARARATEHRHRVTEKSNNLLKLIEAEMA